MAVNETLEQESATDAAVQTENQASSERTYTQQDVDNMMARMRGSLEKKLLKPYEELGDVDELRSLKQNAEQQRQEEAMKRGEYEKLMKELAAKKDDEIAKRDSIIKEYKVNTPLLNAASKYRSVNPEQVQSLLSRRVTLNENGEVDVLDDNGNVRYNDNGDQLTVDDLVKEFLDSNPHFVQPGVGTSNTKSSIKPENKNSELDLAKLDLSNPEHRKIYKEALKKGLL